MVRADPLKFGNCKLEISNQKPQMWETFRDVQEFQILEVLPPSW